MGTFGSQSPIHAPMPENDVLDASTASPAGQRQERKLFKAVPEDDVLDTSLASSEGRQGRKIDGVLDTAYSFSFEDDEADPATSRTDGLNSTGFSDFASDAGSEAVNNNVGISGGAASGTCADVGVADESKGSSSFDVSEAVDAGVGIRGDV